MSSRRVAIVGAALSDCGRVDTKSPFELHYQAASRAVADAGLTKADIDGFASNGTGTLAPVEVAEYLGVFPTWVDGTGVGGSTWEFMVEHATAAIAGRPRRDRRASSTAARPAPTSRPAAAARTSASAPAGRCSSTCRSATPSSRSTRWRRVGT